MFGEPVTGYLLLLLLFVLFFSVSLFFGCREWRRPCGAVPLSMDVDYIRVENYFGQSFRAKMQEWLAEAQPNGVAAGGSAQWFTPGGERLLVLQGGRIGNGAEQNGPGQDEIVYSKRDLTLARRAVFRREIYCQGRLDTEAGVQLQSAAVDGNLVLGEENDVARWVDANGKIVIRSGPVVRSRASSLTSIELERNVSAQSLYAPLITAGESRANPNAAGNPGVEDTLPVAVAESGAPGNWPQKGPLPDGRGSDQLAVPGYLEGLPCTRLEPGTWLVQADLYLPAGSRVKDNLIVKGTLTSGSHCIFSRDVKAARLKLGERNRVLGNLVAEDFLLVGEESFVERNLTAGNHVRLAHGARVGRPESLAVVSARGEIVLESNVAVCGKMTAGRWVRTV